MRQTVVINILSENLDRGLKPSRWERWRPSVDLCRHEDLLIDRMVLLYRPGQEKLIAQVEGDIALVSPETLTECHLLAAEDPNQLGMVYQGLLRFAAAYPFSPAETDYYVHTTTGTQVEQLCLLKLTDSRHFPGRLLQSQAGSALPYGDPGEWSVINLDSSNLTQRPSKATDVHDDICDELRGGIEVESKSYTDTISQIATVCLATHDPIFLTGPMGIGKSELARRIYQTQKNRRKLTSDFHEVDCATIPGERAYAELFGAQGIFSQSQGGLVYLDDIASLSLPCQALLLRSIEQGHFRAVDENLQIPFDVQLILGARTDLRLAVRNGHFREDLWLKIASWRFDLSPLCERPDDITGNIDYALRLHMKSVGRRVQFNPEARTLFETFAKSPATSWKGNFRDFNAAITRMATFASLGKINREHVRQEIKRLKYVWTGSPAANVELSQLLDPQQLTELDRFDLVQLADVLAVCRESRSLSAAGRLLYAESRKRKRRPNDADRLRKYLAKFDLDWNAIPHR